MVDLVCGVDVIAQGLRELNDRPCVSVDVDAEFIWGLLVDSGVVDLARDDVEDISDSFIVAGFEDGPELWRLVAIIYQISERSNVPVNKLAEVMRRSFAMAKVDSLTMAKLVDFGVVGVSVASQHSDLIKEGRFTFWQLVDVLEDVGSFAASLNYEQRKALRRLARGKSIIRSMRSDALVRSFYVVVADSGDYLLTDFGRRVFVALSEGGSGE